MAVYTEGYGILQGTGIQTDRDELQEWLSGADGIRTHYLLTASQMLSRLSYSPT